MNTPPAAPADGPRPLGERWRDAACELVQLGVRQLDLISPTLDARLHGGEAFADAVKQLALASAASRIRILLGDDRAALRNAPQLIELARRLTSRIDIRRLADEDQDNESDCLIVDQRHLLRRARVEALEFQRLDDAAGSVLPELRRFQALWDRAEPSQELRQLGL